MRKIALLFVPAVALVGLSMPASATPCTNQTVTPTLVCTVGDLTFDFLSMTVQPNGNTVNLTGATDINGVITLGFQMPNSTTDIDLMYSVTSTSADIFAVDSSFPTPGRAAPPSSISERVCGVAFDVNKNCSDLLTTLTNTTPEQVSVSSSFGPLSEIWIDKDISPNEFSSFTDSVEETTATPEPSSLALLGTTLLGAAGVARRRLKLR